MTTQPHAAAIRAANALVLYPRDSFRVRRAADLITAEYEPVVRALEALLAHRECPVYSPEAEAARAAIAKARGAA